LSINRSIVRYFKGISKYFVCKKAFAIYPSS